MNSDSDSDNDSDNFDDPYWTMEKKTSLRIVSSYGRRLNEMPAPDLSPAQLEQVLQWQLILTDATHMYEYAMFADGFRRHLSQLDLDKLHPKTLRLARCTLEKIGYGEPEGFPYTEMLAGVAGIASVYLVYYQGIGTNWSMFGSFIPLLVIARSFVLVSQARDRHGLKQGYREGKAYRDSLWNSATTIFYSEVAFPIVASVWTWVKWHPWWSLVMLLMLLSVPGILTDPTVREWRIEWLRLMRFRWAWFEGSLEFHQREVLNTLEHILRLITRTSKSFIGRIWRLSSMQSDTQARDETSFVYGADFQYDQKIRLLRIHRRIPSMGIKAELIEADLKSKALPHYDAISHVWSHGERDHTIELNGVPVSITASEYKILDGTSSYLAPRTIWLDTLCINQQDEVEKVAQIKKMRKIYYNASKVQVYLVDQASSYLAIPFLQQILRAYGGSKLECSAVMMDMILRKKDDTWLRARVDSLLDLFGNEWFERAWVIQEYCTAGHVVVNYGKYSLDWAQFVILAQMLEDEQVPEVAQFLTSGGNEPGTQVRFWVKRAVRFEDWRRRMLSSRIYDFHEILSTFHSCKATKWQDKIIALIGLSGSARWLTDLIDYNLSKETMLHAIAQHLGTEELLKTFPFAGLALLPTHLTNVPSWLADWTASRNIDPIVAGHNQEYDAAKGRNVRYCKQASKSELVVFGALVDVVKEISEADLNFKPDAGTLQANPQLVNQVVTYFASAMDLASRVCTNPYRSGSTPLYEAVSHTMIGNAIKLREPMMWNHHNLISRFLHFSDHITAVLTLGIMPLEAKHPDYLSHSGFQPEPMRELCVHAGYEREPDIVDQIHYLLRDLERAQWLCGGSDTKRRFGVTETGRMGMLPRTTAAGDVVCVLYGAKVPMILRKVPDAEAYQLVGEAYVHGIMEGEGLQDAVEMKFTLR